MMTRLFRLLAWFSLAAIVFVTVSPIDLRPHDVFAVNFDRAAAFASIAALFVLAYPRHWLFAGLAVVVSACAIELLQELSPTRHAHLSDAMVKAAGASIGALLGWAAIQLAERRGERRRTE